MRMPLGTPEIQAVEGSEGETHRARTIRRVPPELELVDVRLVDAAVEQNRVHAELAVNTKMPR